MQGELGSKDDTVKELRRWLDQAQGQLQNTQTALHEREAECKTLSADLTEALAGLKALKVPLPCCLCNDSHSRLTGHAGTAHVLDQCQKQQIAL